MKYSAIILLGGKSQRFYNDCNKVYCLIKNKPIFLYSLYAFKADSECTQIIVVYNKDDEQILQNFLKKYDCMDVTTVPGGSERYLSVLQGLKCANNQYVIVHDGARPNISYKDIANVKEGLKVSDCVSLAVKVTDTIKEVKYDSFKTLDRNYLYYVQTPQGSKKDVLYNALSCVKYEDNITDDLMAVEKYTSVIPKIVMGNKNNVKVTTQEDYNLLKYLMGE